MCQCKFNKNKAMHFNRNYNSRLYYVPKGWKGGVMHLYYFWNPVSNTLDTSDSDIANTAWLSAYITDLHQGHS